MQVTNANFMLSFIIILAAYQNSNQPSKHGATFYFLQLHVLMFIYLYFKQYYLY